jgi:hypothetical protein
LLRTRRLRFKQGQHGFGVGHIDERHPGQLEKLPESWPSMRIEREGPTRISMKNDKAQLAIIPKNFGGDPKNWLLTFYELDSGRPESKLLDSASVQNRAGLFPDRSAGINVRQDWQFLNTMREPASSALNRTASSALTGINPLSPRQDGTSNTADVARTLQSGAGAVGQSVEPPVRFLASRYQNPLGNGMTGWRSSADATDPQYAVQPAASAQEPRGLLGLLRESMRDNPEKSPMEGDGPQNPAQPSSSADQPRGLFGRLLESMRNYPDN